MNRYHRINLRPPLSPEARRIFGYADLSPVPVADTDQDQDQDNTTLPAKGAYYLQAFQRFGVSQDLPPPEASRAVGKGVVSRTPVPEGYDPGAIRVQVTSLQTSNQIEVVAGTQSLTGEDAKGNAQRFTGTLTSADISQDGEGAGAWVGIVCTGGGSGSDTCSDSGEAKSTGDDATNGGGGSSNGGSSRNSNDNQPDAEVALTNSPNVPVSDFAANVSITCDRRAETLADWQYRAYRLIQQGYEAQLERFRHALQMQRERMEAENPQFLVDAVNDQAVQACVAALYEPHLALTGAGTSDKTDTDPVNDATKATIKGAGADTQPAPDLGAPRVFQYPRNLLLWSELHVQLYLGDGDEDGVAMSEGETALLDPLGPVLQFRNFLRAKRARDGAGPAYRWARSSRSPARSSGRPANGPRARPICSTMAGRSVTVPRW